MAKEKQTRRMIAMALAAAVTMSSVPVVAFAEEVGSEGGSTTKTETSTDSAGNKTTTTTTTNSDGSSKVESKTENTDGSSSQTTTTTAGEGTTSVPKVTITVTSVKDTSGKETESSETKETTSTETQNNTNGGTTTTVETKTENTTTENAPTQFVPKDDGATGDDTTPPAEGNGTTGDDTIPPAEGDGTTLPAEGDDTATQKPTGNTDTGFVEGSGASEFVEGTTTDQTTTTEREETTTDTTVTDYKDRVVEESGSSEGSETTTTTETETDKYIQDRDELENDSYTEGEETLVGKDATPTDEFSETEVPTIETTTKVDDVSDYVGNITLELVPGGTDEGSATVDEEKLYQDLLAANRPQPSETKGETITTTEDATDDAGNKIGTVTTATTTDVKTEVNDVKNGDKVVGYGTTTTTTTTVVKTTVVDEVKENDSEFATGETTTTVDNSETDSVVKLPDRPTESETKDAAGATTKVTVENIVDENDQVVGYLKKTVVTNAAGKEIATGSETFWGTYSKTVTTKETLETTTTKTEYITTTTVDTEITKGRVVGGEWITSTARYAKASMGKVIEGVTEDGVAHGYTQLGALNIDPNLLKNLGEKDLFNPNDWVAEKEIDGQTFQYLGHLVGSDYRIYRTNGSGSSNTDVYIYVLKDKDGNEFYGYCCDVATHANKGYLYEISNLEDETYYQGDNAESHIRAIAMNGFWGTSSGIGSLESVQKVLKDYLVSEKGYAQEKAAKEAATLTEGQALAATQAAIWEYGNNGKSYSPYDSNVSKYDFNWNLIDGTAGDKNVQNLYKALTSSNMTLPRDTSTNILDTSDVVGSTITIGDKAVLAEGDDRNTDADTSNDVYNTSVSFTVALVPTDKDDLEVIVYQGGREVGRKSVTADNASSKTDSSATYTLEGLKLQEGLEVNLSLEGTQNLKKGVYLYTAKLGVDASQTFVGVAEGDRTVALDVNMSFDVTDETATRHSKSGSDTRKKSGQKVTEIVDTAIDEEVVAMMEVTSVTITEDGYEWNSEYNEKYSYSNGGGKDPETPKDPEDPKDPKDPGDPGDPEHFEDIGDNDVPLAGVDPEEPVDIGDEEVPLAAADEEVSVIAETGDSNHMTGAFGGMFAALAGMFMLRKKKEN